MPHLLLVVVDDMGSNDAPWQSSDVPTAAMPFTTELQRQGVTLSAFYGADQCTPSRAMLMTGRHASALGLSRTIEWDSVGGAPLDVAMLPELLEAAAPGRYTHKALVGKWDLGHCAPAYLPTNRGFDFYHGLLATSYDDWFSHNGVHVDDTVAVADLLLGDEPDTAAGPVYATDMWASDAVDVVAATDDRLFLYLSFNAVHNAPEVPAEWYAGAQTASTDDEGLNALLAHMAGSSDTRQLLAATLLRVDRGVEATFRAMEARGMADDALVVFLSDNGGLNAGGSSNWPYRGEKVTYWEGGCRTPAFAWVGPRLGRVTGADATAGRTLHGLAHVSDLVPTILSGFLGASPPDDLYGVDLSPYLFFGTATESPRRDLLYNVDSIELIGGSPPTDGVDVSWNYQMFAYRNERYKVLGNVAMCTASSPDDAPVACEADFLGKAYLFDLLDDPTESNNLLDAEPELVDQFRVQVAHVFNTIRPTPWTWLEKPEVALAAIQGYAEEHLGATAGDGSRIFLVPWLEDDARPHAPPPAPNTSQPSDFLWQGAPGTGDTPVPQRF